MPSPDGWSLAREPATVDSSFSAPVSVAPRIVLTGSEGVLENVGDVRVELRRRDGTKERFDFPPGPGDGQSVAMATWAAVVRDAVLDSRPVETTFADGLACMEVMERWRADPPGQRHGLP